uniref:Uncharacterized protein n=1 Tax=Athene cunicularia TaxID=194338 RepID=A0A663LWE2_ATHCN
PGTVLSIMWLCLACVTSAGLIPANATRALSSQGYTTTWNCCQVNLSGAYCAAGADCYQKGKSCSANRNQRLKSAEGKRKEEQPVSMASCEQGGGGVPGCLGSTHSAGASRCSCQPGSSLPCTTECALGRLQCSNCIASLKKIT